MPDGSSIDGFFVAVIAKKGKLAQRTFPKPPKLSDKQKDFFKSYFTDIPQDIHIYDDGKNGVWEAPRDIFPNIRFKRKGLNLYRHAGNKLELTAQGAWEFSRFIKDDEKISLSRKDALDYLKGFDLPLSAEYKGRVVFYDGIAIGTAKAASGVLKNKLDRYFLYGKNIEW